MKNPLIHALLLSALVMIGSVAYAAYTVRQEISIFHIVPPGEVSISDTPAPAVARAYGSVVLKLNETAVFPDVSITPRAVVEDSRCPINARCIQAGTVRLKVEIVSGMGTSTNTIGLGTTITTEAESVTLEGVSPETLAGEAIASSSYRFTFLVAKRPVTDTAPAGGCYVGGCSSQLCTDTPGAVSTCEYRSEYACYKGAQCERQSSGECGWTMTDALRQCLAAPAP